jgi:nucleotide-binding universal stress UspA family protein
VVRWGSHKGFSVFWLQNPLYNNPMMKVGLIKKLDKNMTKKSRQENQPSIVWPIDAFQCDEKMVARVAVAIGKLFYGQMPVVHLVYVLTPAATVMPLRWFDSMIPRLKSDATKAIHAISVIAKKSGLNITEPSVVVEKAETQHEKIAHIMRFVRKLNASLVVIPTHSRSAIKRAFFGSFAESMLLYSKIPLLSVGPAVCASSLSKRCCLLPVDLSSDHWAKVSKKIMEAASPYIREIVFFYHAPRKRNLKLSISGALAGQLKSKVGQEFEDELERRLRAGSQLVNRAEKQGFIARFVYSETNDSTDRVIVRAAVEACAQFIVMASLHRKSDAVFAGSMTRAVIRQSTCPVWALSLSS